MKKRFVVAVASSTEEQNEAFKNKMISLGFNWWHWLPNIWLFIDYDGKFTVTQVRDIADEHYPGINNLALELRSDGDTWAGFGPKTPQRNMFTWLNSEWKP